MLFFLLLQRHLHLWEARHRSSPIFNLQGATPHPRSLARSIMSRPWNECSVGYTLACLVRSPIIHYACMLLRVLQPEAKILPVSLTYPIPSCYPRIAAWSGVFCDLAHSKKMCSRSPTRSGEWTSHQGSGNTCGESSHKSC